MAAPAIRKRWTRRGLDEADFVSGFTREGFIAAVEKSKDYIRAGDIFQVVLSQRLSVPFKARPVDVYRALRALNPSPYMYFLDVGDMQVVGSSPEILVRLQHDDRAGPGHRAPDRRHAPARRDARGRQRARSRTAGRPEGTRRAPDADRPRPQRCRPRREPGTVEVGEQFVIERYSHVMHIVSEVTGTLKPGLSYADVLRATFPAGTVSGAPKIRALEVIRELEPIKRNVYAGSIGYLGWHGDADTAIAIRTAVIQDGRLHVQAGAGIVYDSDPAEGMGGDDEQGPGAVPRGGGGGAGVVASALDPGGRPRAGRCSRSDRSPAHLSLR